MSLLEKQSVKAGKTEQALVVNRVEHKYIITPADVAVLSQKLRLLLQEDIHNGNNGYMVRSLYFDTPGNKDYYAKEDGLFERHKIRLRIYSLEDKTVKLECKSKKGEFQKKTSIILTRRQSEQLIKGDYGVLLDIGTEDAMTVYRKMTGYVPSVVVQYNRRAYFWHVNETRITLDTDICGCETEFDLFSDKLPFTPAVMGNTGILEVKYSGKLEPSIARVLSGCERTQTSFSKYNNTRNILNRL
jgi:hypothetical protein